MKREILDQTHYGLNIYAHVLRQYYPEQTVLSISGKHCQPAINPFRDHKCTLLIVQNGYTFEHTDSEDPNFNGNAFDFAALHYKTEGEFLLDKIKNELHIRLKDKPKEIECEEVIIEPQKPKIHISSFSFYKRPVINTIPYKEVNLVNVYDYIKGDYALKQTTDLRNIKDLKSIREFKKYNFDYVTFSGLFSMRSDAELLKHSGLICVDFDHLPDTSGLKQKLLEDEYFDTEMLFLSPSGDGLKWVVGIDITKHTHPTYFAGLEGYIKQTYGLQIDPSGKDVSRACFLPYDPEVFINSKYVQNEKGI